MQLKAKVIFSSMVIGVLLLGAGGVSAERGAVSPARLEMVGTGFTYQGLLRDASGQPVTGGCDFQFTLWDSLSNGTQIGMASTTLNVNVAQGYFTAQVNAGSEFGARAFTGQARWLAIDVRCPAGSGGYTPLTPRQNVTPAPYALALPGFYTQQVTHVIFTDTVNIIGGAGRNSVTPGMVGATIAGGGTVVYPNQVTDNFGTVSGGYSNTASGSLAAVGGGAQNTGSGSGAVVSGGFNNLASGSDATVGGGNYNRASDFFTTVGGGYDNTAGNYAATVAGGYENTASYTYTTVSGGQANTATGYWAMVGGGRDNLASGAGALVGGGVENTASNNYATVGGGQGNAVGGYGATVSGGIDNQASAGSYAALGGGYQNMASGAFAAMGGGYANTASGESAMVGGGRDNTAGSPYATVGGGYTNTVSGWAATVSGGYGNLASGYAAAVDGGMENLASGEYATVGGGRYNTAAGDFSFVSGFRAQNADPIHDGVFLFADISDFPFYSTSAYQFRVRARGGVQFVTAIDGTTGLPTAGSQLAAGGGAWSSLSDRNLKANFSAVDGRAVLAKVAALSLSTWNYIAQDTAIRHIGPMAQDFYAAFGVGEDDTHITTIDADGVALAAIQGLNEVVQEKDARIAALEVRVQALEQNAGGTGATNPLATPWPWLALVVVSGMVLLRRKAGG